jgi:hypothetical protein
MTGSSPHPIREPQAMPESIETTQVAATGQASCETTDSCIRARYKRLGTSRRRQEARLGGLARPRANLDTPDTRASPDASEAKTCSNHRYWSGKEAKQAEEPGTEGTTRADRSGDCGHEAQGGHGLSGQDDFGYSVFRAAGAA